MRHLFLVSALLASTLPVGAQQPRTGRAAQDRPPVLEEIGFDQRLGEPVPLDLTFLDANDETIALGDLFQERPVILVPVYYTCPVLCGTVVERLAASLSVLDLVPGEDYELVVTSFDPEDTHEEARRSEERFLGRLGSDTPVERVHFLSGEPEAIDALMESLGFRYAWDARIGQYVHASGMVLATPEGRIARYLFGIEPAPRDLRLALVEASRGEIGNLIDQALLYCFQYDPAIGKYSAVALNIVRLGGVVTLVALALLVLVLMRRERRSRGPLPTRKTHHVA